jgi:protein SCO1
MRRIYAASALVAWLSVAGFSMAKPVAEEPDRLEPKPQRLDGVELQEQLGARVPLDTAFIDSSGRPVHLRDYFDGHRPVVLTFNYANCPMLCNLQLGRFVTGLKRLGRTAGEDFQVVTISIDPIESPADAAKSKARYLSDYGRPAAADGWHFLVGGEAGARSVADSVGFTYNYNEERKEWLHPAAVIVLTSEGKVSRYLYGIEYHPDTLNLAIVEASEGKIGSVVDRLVLYCFHYDESEGRYAPVAMNIMRVGAGLVAVVLGLFLGTYWLAESRRRRKASLAPSTVS